MHTFALLLILLQEHEAPTSGGLMSIQINLMFWTLVIFGILFWILRKYAFPVILSAVEAREKALEEAIDAAKRDRDQAASLLAEQKAQIEGARGESQKIIAEARAIAEKQRADTLEKTRQEQQDMLARARRDLAAEHEKAVAQLRREAVDLAIAGAGKVVEENLDSDKNRKIVETFLASLAAESSKPKAESR